MLWDTGSLCKSKAAMRSWKSKNQKSNPGFRFSSLHSQNSYTSGPVIDSGLDLLLQLPRPDPGSRCSCLLRFGGAFRPHKAFLPNIPARARGSYFRSSSTEAQQQQRRFSVPREYFQDSKRRLCRFQDRLQGTLSILDSSKHDEFVACPSRLCDWRTCSMIRVEVSWVLPIARFGGYFEA
ncbi:hypothetical protein BKA81DRAFT_47349 [Phyllosticta paracitricarpa]